MSVAAWGPEFWERSMAEWWKPKETAVAHLADLPHLPRERWPEDGDPRWRTAESLCMRFAPFKCREACAMRDVPDRKGWRNPVTGLAAAELGVPVHQALWVATMREKAGT